MQVELDRYRPRKGIPWPAIKKYIKWSRYELTHVALKNVACFRTVHQTLALLSQCSKLEHLEVYGGYRFTDFYEVFRDFKKLRTLIASFQISQKYIAKLFETLPQLERVQFFTAIGSVSTQVRWPHDLPNLKHLSLDCRDLYMGIVMLVPGMYIPSAFAFLGLRHQRANYVSSPLLV